MPTLSFKFNILRVTVGRQRARDVSWPWPIRIRSWAADSRSCDFHPWYSSCSNWLGCPFTPPSDRHVQWSQERLLKAMARAPEAAIVEILQTWIPEEDFIDRLRHLYIDDGKRFHLRVMLMNPEEEGPNDVLTARVKLRGIERSKAANDIAHSRDSLLRLKKDVDKKLSELARAGRGRAETMDLEIRLYDFMPFGPIYKIGEQVMFIGLYVNDTSSIFGPMIEIRQSRSPELWHDLERSLSNGWDASPTYVPPADDKELTRG